MRMLIQNPAVDDTADQVYWGDYHFGRALSRCLEELDCQVASQFWPNWDQPVPADVLLVLRGIRKVEAIPGDFHKTIIWIISHPADVSEEELRLFDLILCSSVDHTEALRRRGFDAHLALQCTDDSVFFPRVRQTAKLSNAFVFVGNARAERHLIHKAIASGLPLRIWGRGWTRVGYNKCVVDPYIHNEALGQLYRNSFCCLNDHWSDMSEYNYVNNRIFDALACGVPLISDPHGGIEKLGLGGIKIIEPDEPFDDAIDDFIVNYEQYQDSAYMASLRILDDHTFRTRARQIVSLLEY